MLALNPTAEARACGATVCLLGSGRIESGRVGWGEEGAQEGGWPGGGGEGQVNAKGKLLSNPFKTACTQARGNNFTVTIMLAQVNNIEEELMYGIE